MAGIDPKFYYLTLGLLALCTVVGLIVAYRFQREVNVDLAPPTEKDIFDPIEKAFYSGLMDKEEFERIRESLARQKGAEVPAAGKPLKPHVKAAEFQELPPAPEPETEEGVD